MAMSFSQKSSDKYVEEILRLLEDTVGITIPEDEPRILLCTFEELGYTNCDLVDIIINLEEHYEIHIGKKFCLYGDTLEDLINYVSLLKG